MDIDSMIARCGGEMDLALELVETFLEIAPEQMAELRQAVEKKDPREIMLAAHALKGGLGALSAGEAFNLALDLETMGRKQNLASIEKKLAALELMMAGLEPKLTEFIGKQKF